MKQRMKILALASVSAAFVAGWSPLAAQAPGLPEAAKQVLERRAPAGAPNVVVILLDDVGFGAASTFGGPVDMPSLDALAKDGLRYNRFHTSAICSPTRAALLTGRNPHAIGVGTVLNAADARPGYNGFMTKDAATIAEVLRENGYATAAFGKWHLTPDWESSQAGPFDRWPTGQGFDKFYGFLGGETNQFDPNLYNGTTPVLRGPGRDYNLSHDLSDRAIDWIRSVRAANAQKPLFIYYPTPGIHAPIQAPREWVERYRGKFDQGWDKLREQIFAQQKRLGVIPPNAQLSRRPAELPAWESLTRDEKRLASRLMEAYAGYLAQTDYEVGRLVQSLKDNGEYENTMFFYIVGDNGASLEGTPEGSLDYLGAIMGLKVPEASRMARIDEIGTGTASAHVNSAWAWATNAPFQWGKTVASHLGGTRNPMVIAWPGHIKDKGGLRSQFSYVNDIYPTILEAIGIAAPSEVGGIVQKPIDGMSLAYTFDSPAAPDRHSTQYFEVFGNRAIYHDGWMASAFHGRIPWKAYEPVTKSFDQDKWELYDLRTDFSQAEDIASRNPAKLAELKGLFNQEAMRNQVLPLAFNFRPRQGLPDPSEGAKSKTYRQGAIGIPEVALPHLANRSWSIRADVRSGSNALGVIAALGGTDAGISLYFDEDHRTVFTYRMFDLKTVQLKSSQPLTAGTHVIEVNFNYDGVGYGKGGRLTLVVDDAVVATDTLPATPLAQFNIDETFAVGVDTGAPVGLYPTQSQPGYKISGAEINGVTVSTR